MKKFLLIAAIAVFGLTSANAQNASFGVTAGFTNINAEVSDGGNVSVSSSGSGFYVGGLVDVSVSEAFHIQPEILYANAEDSNFLYIPILAKYYISESGFHIMAGPQANLILDEKPDAINTFGLDITFGAGYDINAHFFIDARYALEITNRFNDAPGDASFHFNTLNIGVGYKF